MPLKNPIISPTLPTGGTLRDQLTILGVRVAPPEHKHSRAGWVQVDCPYCGLGTFKFHCGISEARRRANCYRCGRLDAVDVLTRHNVSKVNAVMVTKGGLGRMYEAVADTPERRATCLVPFQLGPLGPAHHLYLANRGIDPYTAEHVWGLRATPAVAREYSWRIWMPYVVDQRVVSWTTRAIGSREPRYISAPADCEIIPAKETLFGIDLVTHTAFVCEGPMDAIAMGPGGVALSGLPGTDAQLALLAQIPVRVIILDNEGFADAAARKMAHILSMYPGDTHIVKMDAKDPAADAATGGHEVRAIREAFGC